MNTKQADLKIDGIGKVSGGDYNQVKIDGIGKVFGDVTFHVMKVDGTCNTTGNLHGEYLHVDGLMKVDGDIKVKEFYIDGVVESGDHKVYADKVRIDGILKNKNEVNADFVKIDGCVSLNDLFGDEININYARENSFFRNFNFFNFGKKNMANNIECSKLSACNITCHSICAAEIYLSDHCVVDYVSCSGKLVYDSTCVIRKIEGECERNIE